MGSLVFLDTETTGLDLDDDIWEFAGIRRDLDGAQTELHLFIEHDAEKADLHLPEKFLADHDARFDAEHAVSRTDAARLIHRLLLPSDDGTKVHVVGAVPSFDTERLALLLDGAGFIPPWHHHLIDVEALAVGFLEGTQPRYRTPLPWNSDGLSRRLGVEPPTAGRHTAMGDALWAMSLYDAVRGS